MPDADIKLGHWTMRFQIDAIGIYYVDHRASSHIRNQTVAEALGVTTGTLLNFIKKAVMNLYRTTWKDTKNRIN